MKKYKRFNENLTEYKIQKFLDELTIGGWEIISYNETYIEISGKFNLILLCSKTFS